MLKQIQKASIFSSILFDTILYLQVNMNETWAEEEGLGMKRVEVKQSHNMLDKETQIYNNDPHLFVFDDEVKITIIITN